MKEKRKLFEALLIIAFCAVFIILTGHFWDFYYSVNDDIATRNVLSGCYTGSPYPQGTQGTLTLYPITAVIAGLYSLVSEIDYWGLFLVASHFVCFFAIAKCVMGKADTWLRKISMFLLTFAIFWMVDMINILFFQFTTVAAVYAAAGIFLLFMEEADIKKNVPSLCMLVMSFCIRKGTTAMILPFVALVWLFKVCSRREKALITIKRGILYFLVFGIVCGGLYAVDICADLEGYRDQYYQEFERLRINAWDYHGIPYYDHWPEFYQSLNDGAGISREEFDLINSANLTMDFSGDIKELLSYITDFARVTDRYTEVKYKLYAARDLFMTVFERTLIKEEVLFTGMILLLAVIYLTINRNVLSILFLFGGIMGVLAEMGVLLLVGRLPERIWQSLLLVAVLWILGICAYTYYESGEEERRDRISDRLFYASFMISCAAVFAVSLCPAIHQKQETYEKAFHQSVLLNQYCAEHTENIYCTPYSLFTTVDKLGNAGWYSNRFNNCIRIGFGSFGPAYRKMLERAGIDGTVEEAVMMQDNVYMMGTNADNSLPLFDSYFMWKYGEDYSYEVVDVLEEKIYVWKVHLRKNR